MAGRTKSPWKVKLDALEAQLPKGFDARAFKGCRIDGELKKDKITVVCEKNNYTDKTDAVFNYLTHQDSKPKGITKKQKLKPSIKKPSIEKESASINLLVKKTYKGLSSIQIGTVISMLSEIQKERKEAEIAIVKARIEKDQKQLEELQGK